MAGGGGAGLPLSPSSGWPPSEPVEAAARGPSGGPSWAPSGFGSTCASMTIDPHLEGDPPPEIPGQIPGDRGARSVGTVPPSADVRRFPSPPPRVGAPASRLAATPRAACRDGTGRSAAQESWPPSFHPFRADADSVGGNLACTSRHRLTPNTLPTEVGHDHSFRPRHGDGHRPHQPGGLGGVPPVTGGPGGVPPSG